MVAVEGAATISGAATLALALQGLPISLARITPVADICSAQRARSSLTPKCLRAIWI
jgi:hypothetical protein